MPLPSNSCGLHQSARGIDRTKRCHELRRLLVGLRKDLQFTRSSAGRQCCEPGATDVMMPWPAGPIAHSECKDFLFSSCCLHPRKPQPAMKRHEEHDMRCGGGRSVTAHGAACMLHVGASEAREVPATPATSGRWPFGSGLPSDPFWDSSVFYMLWVRAGGMLVPHVGASLGTARDRNTSEPLKQRQTATMRQAGYTQMHAIPAAPRM